MPLTTDSPATLATPRRSFLQRLAAASALLAGVTPSVAFAEQGKAPTDPWLAKVTAKHRQVFDAPEPNSGFPAVFAATYLKTMTETYHLSPGGAQAIVVLRHSAMPMALTDAMWDKYAIGAMLNITDPATKAPARRNIFWKSKEGDVPFAQLSIEKVMQMPVTFVACGAALAVLSARAAAKGGVDAATAQKEWTAGIIPGISIVPSGVLAVARAQEHGCSYCYAG